jgi:RecB family exonuclease
VPRSSSFPTVSPTDITTFENCPKQWNEKRILRNPKFKFVVTDAITHGNEVHKRLEMYVKKGEVLPDHLEYLKPILDGLRELGYELYAELECAVTKDWEATTFWAKDAFLRGKVDLVAVKSDSVLIFDYKTGKRKPDPLQLEVYGVMLYEVLGITSVKSHFLWLKTNETDAFDITAENFAQTKADILARIDRIKEAHAANTFEPRTGPLCQWCPILDDCQEAVYWKVKRDRSGR